MSATSTFHPNNRTVAQTKKHQLHIARQYLLIKTTFRCNFFRNNCVRRQLHRRRTKHIHVTYTSAAKCAIIAHLMATGRRPHYFACKTIARLLSCGADLVKSLYKWRCGARMARIVCAYVCLYILKGLFLFVAAFFGRTLRSQWRPVRDVWVYVVSGGIDQQINNNSGWVSAAEDLKRKVRWLAVFCMCIRIHNYIRNNNQHRSRRTMANMHSLYA